MAKKTDRNSNSKIHVGAVIADGVGRDSEGNNDNYIVDGWMMDGGVLT